MKVVGYVDRLSVQPGQTIQFMVSCEDATYRADVVRLIHGDDDPRGPGFKAEPVASSVSGEYAGQRQGFPKGSYVAAPDSPLLHPSTSFTLQAWIYPTTPAKGAKGVMTSWAASEEAGYGLFVGDDGSLGLWLGNSGADVERVQTGVPMRPAQWYFVAAAYDGRRQRVSLYQKPLGIWPDEGSEAVVEQATQLSGVGKTDAPFLIAAHSDLDESGSRVVRGHFNGKIDSPRAFSRALSSEEIGLLERDGRPSDLGESLVAAWDFSVDFSSAKVTDTSPNGRHGKTVNIPARAMTGHNWGRTETDFRRAPGEYGAIHFHDDDLEDAGWEPGFELTVPEDTKSGVYAARLKAGGEVDYVPYFVRPKRGTASAPIAFLAPTTTYVAYANFHLLADPEIKAWIGGVKGGGPPLEYPVQPHDKYSVEHELLSLYEHHSDRSGVAYSSRMRPILNMRPGYRSTSLTLGGGGAHLFNADLQLLDWMEAKGNQFDVVTDEDLHHEGEELLASYKVVVTGTHPEYWTAQMLDGLEGYLAAGGRLMYLGGNGFYWVTSVDPERPHVIEVRRWGGTETWEAEPGEYHHSTTGEIGGLWRFRGRLPQRLLGVGFTAQGYDEAVPYTRGPGSFDPRASFIFEGVGDDEPIGDFGLVVGGAGGFEVDRADPALGTPTHTLVLATASGLSDIYQHATEEVLLADSRQGGTVNPLVRADMVYFDGPKGGAVFSVGSISWCGSLSHNDYDNNVSRITGNVLGRFSCADPLP